MDMSSTIAPKSDQLNADSLLGGPMTITITRVSANEGSVEQPINVFFDGDGGKPYRPAKSMRRVMVGAWGPDTSRYVGRSLTLYCDPEVTFGGMKVGGVRISHMSHIDRDMTMALTASKAQRKPYTVRKMDAPKPVEPPAPEPTTAELKSRAELAAAQGTVTFKAFWQDTLTKAQRQSLAGDLAGFRVKAAEADAKGAPDQADPFTPDGDDVRLDADGDVDDGTGDVLDDDAPREREPGEEG